MGADCPMNITANRRNILSNLGWSVLGKVVSLSGSLLVGLLIARYLGPERWGLMNYIISEVFLFQVFAIFGLDSIEIREQARCPNEVHSARLPELLHGVYQDTPDCGSFSGYGLGLRKDCHHPVRHQRPHAGHIRGQQGPHHRAIASSS